MVVTLMMTMFITITMAMVNYHIIVDGHDGDDGDDDDDDDDEFFAVTVGPAVANRGSESAQPQLGAGGCHHHHNHDHDHYDCQCHGYRDHQGASVIVILEIPFHHDNQSHYIVHTSYITQS